MIYSRSGFEKCPECCTNTRRLKYQLNIRMKNFNFKLKTADVELEECSCVVLLDPKHP